MALRITNEANRCLQCKRPMCREGCPAHTPIPQAIALFKENRLMEAGHLLRGTACSTTRGSRCIFMRSSASFRTLIWTAW